MSTDTNIFGCFASGPTMNHDDDQATKDLASEQAKIFRSYIWGEKGLVNVVKQLRHADYGSDLVLVLFQFYINPIAYQLKNLKDIEDYRKKEKAIGIPIIVNRDNFFSRSEDERLIFLKQAMIQKLDLLKVVIEKKKLDTQIDRLKADFKQILL